jgi:hypothetical protein
MIKQSIEELQQHVRPLKGYVGRKLQHVNSGDWYRLTAIHFREADMTIEFSYETCHRDPVSFIRPIGELLDGRFIIGPES